MVRVKVDRKATAISLLTAIAVRRDGQKVLLALKNMGGESTAAWCAFLEDMTRRGLRAPEFVIVDGAPGPEAALSALWPNARSSAARFTRNLLAHAPKRLRDELTNDYRDMIYVETAADVEARRKAFLRKWRRSWPFVWCSWRSQHELRRGWPISLAGVVR